MMTMGVCFPGSGCREQAGIFPPKKKLGRFRFFYKRDVGLLLDEDDAACLLRARETVTAAKRAHAPNPPPTGRSSEVVSQTHQPTPSPSAAYIGGCGSDSPSEFHL
ncbi:uncharacterized protein K452DRAFT_46741 [Aplosporella prunicola CBS 121167]|uniref:Uncharacterized protein n=1 Tax=Aplosporella prunicola CBS 121167 TaxID=1176127 RepID=A0A6A6BB23_9PEZI|nr:uncharacterized protein K452DRAFT_46741 [Aplosporella prunicola CBS 121167]KAF2140445.1 hypothetical protein K452DRAFT_46741 [Aplosporella prunicola CBS 121167]